VACRRVLVSRYGCLRGASGCGLEPHHILGMYSNTTSCQNHRLRRRIPVASNVMFVLLSVAVGCRAVGLKFCGTLSAHARCGTGPVLGTADVHERLAATYAWGLPIQMSVITTLGAELDISRIKSLLAAVVYG
jgi:hypothetical protein